jgi:hypothetical protein
MVPIAKIIHKFMFLRILVNIDHQAKKIGFVINWNALKRAFE